MQESPSQIEKELRHRTKKDDGYPDSSTTTYLSSLPRGVADDVLAEIAQDADRERPTIWSYLLAIIIIIVFFGVQIDLPNWFGVNKNQAGARAALYLARRSDLRAVVPLTKCWYPGIIRGSLYQDEVEKSLIQLLSSPPGALNSYAPTAALAELAERVWHRKRLSHDLTPSQRDLMVALVRHLSGRGSEAQATFQMLQEAGGGDNRTLVRRALEEARVGVI